VAEEQQGNDNGLLFCNALLQTLRLVKLYETDNVAWESPLKAMEGLIAQAADRGGIRLQAEDGMLYYNKEPLRGGKRAFGTIQGLVKGLELIGVAELAFLQPMGPTDLRTFFGVVKAAVGGAEVEDVARTIQGNLEGVGLKDRVVVYAPGETTGKAIAKKVDIDERTYFPLAYARTLVLLREYVRNLQQEELNRYFAQKLHRALQEIVGLTTKYFNRWLALTAVKTADQYLFNHMANTGVLSILLGHQLGIPKVKLTELGYVGMLAPLGLFRTSREVVEKGNLTGAEEADVGLHPYRGLAAHLEAKKITPKMLTAAVVGFQYDLHRGKTPVRVPPSDPHPYVKIIRICEAYDAMTSPRSDRQAMLPDQALKALIEAKQGWYDPLTLTVFTNMMGLFPTGTTVTLSTGEVAVVVHPNPEQPRRPLVAIVRGREGEQVDGDLLDLALKVEDQYPAVITGSVDPSELGITIPDYLLS
jgi:HD-GYP domain-containing protein (c-di-GMP phosphodiesterase class II)